jgi:hypothetical protein
VDGVSPTVAAFSAAEEEMPNTITSEFNGHSGAIDEEERAIRSVFTEYDGKLELKFLDIKAANQKDYVYRLVHMFLYARKVLLGMESTPRADVYDVTSFARLPKNSVSPYLSTDKNVEKNGDGTSIGLRLSAIEHARQCFREILDTAVPAGKYIPSGETKSAPKVRRVGKRSDKGLSEDKMKAVLAHPETQSLVSRLPHAILSDMAIIDKGTVALYGLRKAGVEGSIYYVAMSDYLHKVFRVSLPTESLRKSFRKATGAKEAKAKHIVFKLGEGWQITPSGEKYVEGKLQPAGSAEAGIEQAELAES